MSRVIRYQGAILYNHQLLLIKHREHATGHSYWVIPGGGIEVGEAEEACVQREMHEETHLEVEVGRLLLDEPAAPGGVYQRRKTYLCRPISGEAQPGYEPEHEAAQQYGIVQVGWFDLRDATTWDSQVFDDSITCSLLQRLQEVLGYSLVGLDERQLHNE
jgi:8-oxo-dGTP pyrophosphatase MutT (NUDIX family)